MKRTSNLVLACTAIAISITALGCETLTDGKATSKKKKDSSSWSMFKKKEYQIPQTMNVTWAYDILTLPGKSPTRGFGGRFYFYNEKTQAIPVDGDLVVYGFDDTHKQKVSEDLNEADKRFRFTAEQFTTHFSEGELGASYSVWIPWDEAYGPQRKIMLIPTFLTKDGRLIRGTAASLNLPGKSSEETTPGLIQQASASIPTSLPSQAADARRPTATFDGSNNQSSGMRTTTIQVPTNSLKNHAISPEVLSAMNALQNQPALQNQFAMQNQSPIPATNANGQYQANPEMSSNLANPVSMADPNFQASQVPAQQVTTPNLNTHSFFNPPTAMPSMRSSTSANNPNGWALPEFSQPTYSGLGPRSAPSQLPVQASQGVQPVSYPTR
jgi:hypothetical protein